MDEIGIYVHIPFCVRKCPYCDFCSGKYQDYVIDSYINALFKEIDERRPLLAGRRLDSIYIGGGTPSSISPSYIGLILNRISNGAAIEDDTEISIEVNPGTSVDYKIKDYVSYGINRVSIGLQSAIDSELQALGRIHTYDNFKHTYDAVRSAGIENISIDLMTSIPHQTKGSLLGTLQEVVQLKPSHISAYSLIIEEGTPFYEAGAGNLDLPGEDDSIEIYKLTQEYLKTHGYERYEISNYARTKDVQCRHNLRYWNRGDYLGFGASAASLYGNHRFTNTKDVGRYTAKPGGELYENMVLRPEDEVMEYMFLGLRKIEGVSEGYFKECFGTEMRRVYGKVMDKQIKDDLAREYEVGEDTWFALTDKGLDVSNIVMSEYIFG